VKGQRIGYIRVSTEIQNEARQLDGCEVDRIFLDRSSGKNTERPQLAELMHYVREGDIIICHSIDRLARNLVDLRRMVSEFVARGVSIQFIKENLLFNGNDTPISVFLLNVMGAFAEFERAIHLERQREGIAIAKKNGLYRGRKKSLKPEQIEELLKMVALGVPKAKIGKHLGVSRESVYNYIERDTKQVSTPVCAPTG